MRFASIERSHCQRGNVCCWGIRRGTYRYCRRVRRRASPWTGGWHGHSWRNIKRCMQSNLRLLDLETGVMDSFLKPEMRCPGCGAKVVQSNLATLAAKKEAIICGVCGAKSVVAFNERMPIYAVFFGGVGSVVGFVASYGFGHPQNAPMIALLVGTVVTAFACYRFAFRLVKGA